MQRRWYEGKIGWCCWCREEKIVWGTLTLSLSLFFSASPLPVVCCALKAWELEKKRWCDREREREREKKRKEGGRDCVTSHRSSVIATSFISLNADAYSLCSFNKVDFSHYSSDSSCQTLYLQKIPIQPFSPWARLFECEEGYLVRFILENLNRAMSLKCKPCLN